MMPARTGIKGTADQGLTLIELVIAMSVFALIAVMGLQSLSGSLRLRDRLSGMADQADALGQGASLLRHDLQSVIPMLFYPAGRGRPRSALEMAGQGQGFSLSIATETENAAPLGRIDWRLDPASGALLRRTWPTLYPVSADQVGPEVSVWQDVTALRLRSYWDGVGWVDGLDAPATISSPGVNQDGDGGAVLLETYSDALPLALEITVVTREHGDIRLLESLK